MPIHEVKNPAPLPKLNDPPRRKADPVEKIAPVIRVRHMKKEWRQPANPGRSRELDETAGGENLAGLRRMIDKVNDDFARGNIAIHLSLLQGGETYTLEIYDCTSGTVCEVLKDREIRPDALHAVLIQLQQEAGLVIDTIS